MTPHKVYVLKGNNTENKQKWMQSISKQCGITSENKAFEELNDKIRKAEQQRAIRDEKLVLDCQNLESLVTYPEGVKLLSHLIPDDILKSYLSHISDYKVNAETKPTQALILGDEVLDSLDEMGEDDGLLTKPEIEHKRSLLHD